MAKDALKEKTIIFINKVLAVHGDKYNYSLVNYINAKTKIKIICPKHGIFEQTPDSHLRGSGCPKCKNEKFSNDYVLDNNEFKKRAILKHYSKYDYSLVDYVNSKTKVKIICPIHGEFKQTPTNHLSGNGCKKCGVLSTNKEKSYSLEEIKRKFKEIHGDKYDYSLVNYINVMTMVKIICPIHGEFEQLPHGHISGRGCPKCGIIKRTVNISKTKDDFITNANIIHNNEYNYSLVDYINCKIKVKIICSKHGEFEQTPDGHIQGQGCPKCINNISKPEINLQDFIKSLNIRYETNNRSILNGKELDIFLPDKNIAIEFNGLYWHSELFKDKNYHLNKTKECEVKGIRLLHIFEDEWLFKPDIVKSRIKNIIGLTENKIYARKCIIKEVNSDLTREFLDNNHLQGNVNSSINIGLYYNDELVSLMTFNKPRSGIGSKYDGYELSRFSNLLNTNVIGAASKLLKYFENTYKPVCIKSYADLRWSDGNLYNQLGFYLSHINKPNYWYIINGERHHRFGFRKQILKGEGFDIENKTEHEIMLERGLYRIYDCGTITYVKNKNYENVGE